MPWHVLNIHSNIHKSEKNKNTCNMQSFYIYIVKVHIHYVDQMSTEWGLGHHPQVNLVIHCVDMVASAIDQLFRAHSRLPQGGTFQLLGLFVPSGTPILDIHVTSNRSSALVDKTNPIQSTPYNPIQSTPYN